MKKRMDHAFGKDTYLLGVDCDGVLYWLEAAQFDCGWYWGGGYVETYTNNKYPGKSRDIESHQHFDSLFFNRPRKNGFDAFKEFFTDTPFSDDEIWKICELLKAFYTARDYSDMLYTGGAHYTSNPAKDHIQNETEYQRINKDLIPALFKELYSILGGKEGAEND